MDAGTKELEALVLRLADGDRTAFDALYEALCPLVRKLCMRMLRGRPEADDAAQEAMIKVFARAAQFEAGHDVRTWVLAVTAYECKTQLQKRRRRREGAEHELAADERLSPEAAAVARDLEAAALEVLGSLRATDVATLHAVLSGERPALPQATFRKRVERAVGRLRAAWSSRHGD